jgi:hypothetical protein
MRKAEISAPQGSLVFPSSLTLDELGGEAAHGAEKQRVNKAAFVQQKFFDNPERDKK